MTSRSDTTRAKLLQAARAEFAEHGLAGARVDRIAQSAGVNKERIYGLFGSKDGLFEAVLASTLGEATAALELRDDEDFSAYVGRKLTFHRDHPDFTRLNMWESLQTTEPVRAEERGEVYAEKARRLAETYRTTEAQARCSMILALALGTVQNTMGPLVELIMADTPREQLDAFLREAARRVAESMTSGTEPQS